MRSEDGLREHVALDRWLAGVKADAVRQFVESAIKPEKIKELSDMHLAESVRELQAQAWEEGYAAGDADAHTENRLDSSNPYTGENK